MEPNYDNYIKTPELKMFVAVVKQKKTRYMDINMSYRQLWVVATYVNSTVLLIYFLTLILAGYICKLMLVNTTHFFI